ncbi:MAG: SCO family protein [Pseudotabrizicola sp.]|uniref:SCO family protein n=1 Tax=Pseudotabrizicola sp. TaxID=2939647 RepID=UPI002720C979|nr:SCO family protein [Pseudotabrizicola sp.]MDO8882769.1 SCO family protein [Pseudotabrizicola sp.]MDP2083427.1 SCO family protein [Pseudotabrizicola sp.]MDZ7574965.1 SCO family protein [Pseudotabrizicola sp.]
MEKTYAAMAAAAVVGLLGGTALYIYLGQGDDAFAQCRGGQVGGGDIGGAFTLVDEAGATVTDVDVLAKPSLIYFGYTFCPDVCPLDAARNAEAVDILEEQGFDVTPIFISIDPERDTPEVMAEFTENLHPHMIGLTGSPEQVRVASQAYKTFYRKQDGGDPEFYLVDHSTFTYLTLPGIGFVDFFRREDTAVQMADRVACFVLNAPNAKIN